MNIAKDFQNVLFSFGVIFITLTIGTYVYYTQPTLPEDLSATGIADPDSMDDWILTQTETDTIIVLVSSSTEPLEVAPTTTEPVVPTPVKSNTQFSDAIARQIADQKAAQEKATADALAAKIAAEKLAEEALAAQIAKDKAAADAAAAAKKSRKSRAS